MIFDTTHISTFSDTWFVWVQSLVYLPLHWIALILFKGFGAYRKILIWPLVSILNKVQTFILYHYTVRLRSVYYNYQLMSLMCTLILLLPHYFTFTPFGVPFIVLYTCSFSSICVVWECNFEHNYTVSFVALYVYTAKSDYHKFIYKFKIFTMCQVKFSKLLLTSVLFKQLNSEHRGAQQVKRWIWIESASEV